MALTDSAVLIPGRGTVFTAPIGTSVPNYHLIDPTNTTTFPGWDCLGHTSRDNTVALSKDGGDAEVKGSWWSTSLRSVYADVTWGLTVNALQIDVDTFDLAYNGAIDTDPVNGGYVIPDKLTPLERAILVLIVDGTGRMGLEFPRTTVTLGDAPEIDVENFFETQLSAQALGESGRLFRILHPNFDPTP